MISERTESTESTGIHFLLSVISLISESTESTESTLEYIVIHEELLQLVVLNFIQTIYIDSPPRYSFQIVYALLT